MAPHNLIQRPHGPALSMLLPPAELEIMRLVWTRGPLTVRAVHTQLAQQRPIAYTSTTMTMSRLAEKGLLHRESRHPRRRSSADTYTATIDEQELISRAVQQLIECIKNDYPAIIQYYFDAAV